LTFETIGLGVLGMFIFPLIVGALSMMGNILPATLASNVDTLKIIRNYLAVIVLTIFVTWLIFFLVLNEAGLSKVPFDRSRQPNSELLWDEEKTKEVEENSKVIWVATPNFAWDFDDSTWRDIVFQNITIRQVRYYYLYKDTEDNRAKVDELSENLSAALNNWDKFAHFIPLTADEFIWYTEHVFYNPSERYEDDSYSIAVSMVATREGGLDLNAQLNADMALLFKNQFTAIWNSKLEDKDKYWIIQ